MVRWTAQALRLSRASDNLTPGKMGEPGLVSTLQGVPTKSTLKRGHRTIRDQPHSVPGSLFAPGSGSLSLASALTEANAALPLLTLQRFSTFSCNSPPLNAFEDISAQKHKRRNDRAARIEAMKSP